MTWHPDVSALILAGGKATRFGGIAKHAIVVDGETILARQLSVLRPRVTEVIVSTRPGGLPDDLQSCRVVFDRLEDIGPLAGIAAGLAACRTSWLLVVAGDMPYITGELLDQLLQRVEDVHEATLIADAIGVRSRGLPEPLLSVLHSKRVLPVVEARIAGARYKASGLLTDEGLAVAWIDDADPGALRNVNSPEDLRE